MKKYIIRFMALVCCMAASLTASAQFSATIEMYPMSNYNTKATSFKLSEVAAALETEPATLVETLDAWVSAETVETNYIFLGSKDAEGATNYTQGGRGQFWMDKEGNAVSWGNGSCWYNLNSWSLDDDTYTIAVGQFPDALVVGDKLKARFILAFNEKEATFDITLKVIEKSEIPTPVTNITGLTIIGQQTVKIHQDARTSYDSTPIEVNLEGVAELLGTTPNVIADNLDQLLFTTTYVFKNEKYMPTDSLTKESSASGIGWWFGQIWDNEQANFSDDVARFGYNTTTCCFFSDGYQFNAETSVLTSDIGQMPNALKGGETRHAHVYLIWGEKAYLINYDLIIDKDEADYLMNAGFDEDLTFQADGTMKTAISTETSLSDRSWAYITEDNTVYARPKSTSAYSRPDGRKLDAVNGFIGRIKGWQIVTNQDFPKCEWVYFGSVPYALVAEAVPLSDDGNNFLTVPNKPAELNTDDNKGALYLSCGWGAQCSYLQTTTLPKGTYQLEYWTINVNSSSTAVPTNLTNVSYSKANGDVLTFTDNVNATNTSWVKHTIDFELETSSECTIEIGWKFANSGSRTNPWIYVDGVQLITVSQEEEEEVKIICDNKTREYGEANPELTYTSEGAALTGTPSLNCLATKTSPVGEYPIVASKGNVQNSNVSYVNGTLTVTKAPLTITVNSVTKKQGEAMPTFEFSYSGFKNGETEAVLSQKPTATCSATEGSPKGTYDITVDGAVAQNYEISYEGGTLTVEDADMITITADDKSRQYGEENPTFTFTYEGATLDGTPSLTCAATATSSVGTYPIVASKGSVKNYNDHYVNGTLTITKAPLTITVQSTTKKVGEAMPPFELSYSGFKNGETVAVLTKKPTVTCSATADSPIGNYDIIVSGAEAENYEISYVNGTLTVLDDDEVVVVSADNKSREYGEVNPELTYKSTGIAFEGTPVLSCAATATSPAGVYDIIVEKGSISADNPRLINGILTVTKAPLTITVTEVSKPKGAPNPEFTVTYSGFKNGETEATEGVFTKMPVISCNANADSPVGTYQITVSGAEATNYDITYVNGLLTVYSDLVVVMAESKSREYGEKNPELTYTSAGYELTGEPSLTCEATETSPVGGHYDIVVSRGSVTNYDLSTVNGSLTVTAAPLTITVNPASKKQGEPMPDFTVTYSGFKNGETAETALQGELNFLCDATKDSPDGQYDIIASGLTAQNYDITFVKGVLTVTEDPLVVVTAGSYTVEYGEPLPTLGYTPEGAELVGTPSIACEAVQGSPAGTYYITITRGSVTNYNAQFVNGTLTITQAPLRVKAQDVTRYEFEENPALALTYSGWKMEDDEGALTKLPVASTVADANSLPGVYDITVSGGEARNYELSYEKGTLTVHALPNNVVPYQDMSFQFPDEQVHEVKLLAVKAVQHAVIPTSISFRGAEWTVTAVADSALAGQEQLVTVEVPATVTTVGKDVFDGCSHLAAIMWRAPVKMTSTMMGQYSNPNLLLYVTDKTNALEGVTNVIDLNSLTAERIVLTDDGSTNDFYCPAAFTANEISYTHDYQQQTKSGSSQGWETLALPFDVAAMSHEQKGTIHPFGALTDTQISNGARPFWLYQFTETFGFREADAIRANTPYIISMPNEEGLWQGFILLGKVTFSSTNVKVRATSEAVGVQRGNRTLTPNYQRAEATDVYVLNVGEAYDGYAEGSVFTKGHRGTHPFEAYFTTTSDVKAFGVFDELADDVWGVENLKLKIESWAGAVYDMQGRKIVNRATTDRKLPKGLYIVNGKKVSVKE